MISEKAAQPTLETILRPGQTVAGKYCVDHLIASGGMAAVWAGTNLRTGKRVALKVILRSFAATPGAEELFRREALAASRVNHPNVVTVFDVVDHATRTCIVMEYLDGEDLGAYFQRQGLLGLEEAVSLLLPAMRGVAAANAQGVVHRDLKPKNIFLCIDPGGRLITTKILDFGISVIVETSGGPRSKTVRLMTHGTPTYMSPEHITGSPDIDERTDVYGFGVILFEALAGQAPYVGPVGPDLLTRILEEPVPKLRRFRPDLSPEIEDIVERAIAKNPDDRFPTLNEFIAALEDHVLPRSQILRSLTPSVGVPIIDSASGPRRLADPVVQVVRRDPSGEHDGGVTKALFTLSRGVPPKKVEQPSQESAQPAVVAPTASVEQAFVGESAPVPLEIVEARARSNVQPIEYRSQPTARTRTARTSSDDDTASLMRTVQKRTRAWRLFGVAVAVGAVSVAIAWFVIPDRPPAEHYSDDWQTRPTAHEPPVSPSTPTEPIPPNAARTYVGEQPAAALPPEVPTPLPEGLAPMPEEPSIDDTALARAYIEARLRALRAAAASRSAPKGASRNSDRVSGSAADVVRAMPRAPEPATPRPAGSSQQESPSTVAAPPKGSATRAGRLSTDDF